MGILEPGSLRPAWASSSHVAQAILQVFLILRSLLMLGCGPTSSKVLPRRETLGLISSTAAQNKDLVVINGVYFSTHGSNPPSLAFP